MIHLGRRRQAVREELDHNAAPGILRDSHSTLMCRSGTSASKANFSGVDISGSI